MMDANGQNLGGAERAMSDSDRMVEEMSDCVQNSTRLLGLSSKLMAMSSERVADMQSQIAVLNRRLGNQTETIQLMFDAVKELDQQCDALLRAVKQMVSAMRIQEKRETEEFHLSAEAFQPMWTGAVEFGEHCLREIEGGAT